jgi:hypothetical protein
LQLCMCGWVGGRRFLLFFTIYANLLSDMQAKIFEPTSPEARKVSRNLVFGARGAGLWGAGGRGRHSFPHLPSDVQAKIFEPTPPGARKVSRSFRAGVWAVGRGGEETHSVPSPPPSHTSLTPPLSLWT